MIFLIRFIRRWSNNLSNKLLQIAVNTGNTALTGTKNKAGYTAIQSQTVGQEQ